MARIPAFAGMVFFLSPPTFYPKISPKISPVVEMTGGAEGGRVVCFVYEFGVCLDEDVIFFRRFFLGFFGDLWHNEVRADSHRYEN